MLENRKIELIMTLERRYDLKFHDAHSTEYAIKKMKGLKWEDECWYRFDIEPAEICRIDNDFDLRLYFGMLIHEGRCTFKELCHTLGFAYQTKNVKRMQDGVRRLWKLGLVSNVDYKKKNNRKGSTMTYDICGTYLGMERRKPKIEDYTPMTEAYKVNPYGAARAKKKEFIDGDEEDFDFGFH